MYVSDATGKRTSCFHPCEGDTIWDVLKPELHWLQRCLCDTPFSLFDIYERNSKLTPLQRFLGFKDFRVLVNERTGVYSNYYCCSCRQVVQLDPKRDRLLCPDCFSPEMILAEKLIGKQCPQCTKGAIIVIDTGMIT